MQKITIGSIVEGLCGKCNDVMGHTIMVMLGETIAKVECRACGSVHRFRPAGKSLPPVGTVAAKKERSSPRAATGAKSQEGRSSKRSTELKGGPSRKEIAAATAVKEQWSRMAGRRRGDTSIPYAPTAHFAKNDLIQHTVFGLGEVVSCIPLDKIDVLFEVGIKRLICNKE